MEKTTDSQRIIEQARKWNEEVRKGYEILKKYKGKSKRGAAEGLERINQGVISLRKSLRTMKKAKSRCSSDDILSRMHDSHIDALYESMGNFRKVLKNTIRKLRAASEKEESGAKKSTKKPAKKRK